MTGTINVKFGYEMTKPIFNEKDKSRYEMTKLGTKVPNYM